MTPDPSAPGPAVSRAKAHVAGFLALAVALVAQLSWSWRRWADLLVDFGRELYLPWQLASGRVLYHDITYLNGPLSPYLNAGLFSIFGVSYRTLIVANLVVMIGVAALLWTQLSRTGSLLAAYAATAVFLLVFAIGHYAGIGNYNFLSPYYHEATHGTLLLLIAIAFMSRSLRSWSPWPIASAALALGLVALTKVEIALAGAAVTVVFMVLTPAERRLRTLAIGGSIAPLPYLAATAFFARYMSFHDAARATLGSLGFVVGTDIGKNDYYARVTGLDAPIERLLELGVATAAFAAGLVAAVAFARVIGRDGASATRRWLAWAGLTALAASAALVRDPDQTARVLPAAAAAGLVWLFVLAREADPAERARFEALSLFATFALFYLVKMGLAPRIAHYGFYLAMPAFVLSTALLISLVPQQLVVSVSGIRAFRIAVIAFLAILSMRYVDASRARYSAKTTPIGPPADAIYAYHPMLDPRTVPAAQSAAWLETNLRPGETFVAIPEGLMLNYLTRHPNPTRFLTFTYPEILAFRETAMLDDLERTSPDYVVLVHRDPSEYGVGMWGQDPRYGKRIMSWVDRNYRPVIRFGSEPFNDKQAFGIKILKRR